MLFSCAASISCSCGVTHPVAPLLHRPATPLPMSTSISSFPIRVSGVYSFTPDVSTHRPELSHSFEFDASHASVTIPTEVDLPITIDQDQTKPQRLTANTFATTPEAIERTCPSDETLTQLVRLLHQAKAESDRYLTIIINEEEDRRLAALPKEGEQTTNVSKKRKNDDEEAADGGETNEGDKKAKIEE